MNVRELINKLLEETRDLDQEVFIETKYGSKVGLWNVFQSVKGGYKILAIETDDNVYTRIEAEDDFGS